MEGRLKKIGNEYKLYAQDDSCIATTYESPYKKLSKQNCDEVYGGNVEMVTWVDLAATPTDSRHPDAYLGTDTGIPKLDENGCLILKRK